jgi:hypothetical protein
MFKKQKNELLEIITGAGYEPHDFKPTEIGEIFALTFRDSAFKFEIEPTGASFKIRRTRFLPGYPVVPYALKPVLWSSVEQDFRSWLGTQVKQYLEELDTPDLWENISRETPVVVNTMFDDSDTTEFSAEEKSQLRLSISQFRLLIQQNFHPTDEQFGVIDERLDYLSGALDRLNKFDWKSILISSVVGIATTLTLSPEQGKLLFNLLKQAFSNIIYLQP